MRTTTQFIAAFVIFFSFCLLQSEAGTSEIKILKPDPSLNRTSNVLANKIVVRFKSSVHDVSTAQKFIGSKTIEVTEQLLDKKQSFFYNNDLKNQATIQSSKNISRILETEDPLLRTFYIDYEGNEPPEKFCRKLLAEYPDLEIAEPLAVDEMLGSYTPNDPRINEQTVLKKIQAYQAWSIFKGDTNVVIGISDNGIFQNHEDINGNIARNWKEIPNNGKDDDGNGFVDDFTGVNLTFFEDGKKPNDTYNPSESHGTSVASIAGAETDNSLGMAGVGFKCRIFPIKTAIYNTTDILYGYRSILYAAVRGLKVLNCSWGSVKNFSAVDQSVIDYAVARDVAIVVAAGNGNNSTALYYPAGYRGVLGVGEVDGSDQITSGTTIGYGTKIMAQGMDNLGARNGNSYETLSGGGTSFASPVVAGVVAMVRAKYPQLSAMQALEYVRQSTDEIDLGSSPVMNFLIPGRVNMLKAIQQDDIKIPSIRPLDITLINSAGQITNRFGKNDTAKLIFNCYNYLAKASNLKFVLRSFSESGEYIQVLDSVINLTVADADSPLNIGQFSIKYINPVKTKIFLRVDIYGENEYHDFFLKEYMPISDVTTFSNKVMKFSVGDRGTFGYGLPELDSQGAGFVYKGNDGKSTASQLFKSCLIATESSSKAVSGLYSRNFSTATDFSVEKVFTGANPNVCIINDSTAYYEDKIGLRIELEFQIPNEKIAVTKVLVKMTNISGKSLKDVALGYYLDWDIGFDTDSNKVRLFPEAIPEFFAPVAAAAEVAESVAPGFHSFGAMAFHPLAKNQAQAAGMTYEMTKSFPQATKISALNTGTEIQVETHNDINMTVGMKFPGSFEPLAEQSFIILIGGAESPEILAENMKSVLLGTEVKENIVSSNGEIMISPNPSSDFIEITKPSEGLEPWENSSTIRIFNVFGEKIEVKTELLKNSQFSIHNSQLRIDVSGLPSGVYFVRVGDKVGKFVKIK